MMTEIIKVEVLYQKKKSRQSLFNHLG